MGSATWQQAGLWNGEGQLAAGGASLSKANGSGLLGLPANVAGEVERGRVAGWPGGRVAGWQGGRVAGWQGGRVAGWQGGRVAGWQGGRTSRWNCALCADCRPGPAAAGRACLRNQPSPTQ
jgi:hypothetical protein